MTRYTKIMYGNLNATYIFSPSFTDPSLYFPQKSLDKGPDLVFQCKSWHAWICVWVSVVIDVHLDLTNIYEHTKKFKLKCVRVSFFLIFFFIWLLFVGRYAYQHKMYFFRIRVWRGAKGREKNFIELFMILLFIACHRLYSITGVLLRHEE